MDSKLMLFFFVQIFYVHTSVLNRTRLDDGAMIKRTKRSGGYPKFPVSSMNSCGIRNVEYNTQRGPKIVGGNEPPYGSFPWQVDIKMYIPDRKKFQHHCGGAIIGPRLVITAAHCLQAPLQVEYLRVVVGEHKLRRKDDHEESFKVDKYMIHPDFRKIGPYSHDIALLRLTGASGGITFNMFVAPICLPLLHDAPSPGTWCFVTGWGATDGDDLENLPDVLNAAGVPILDMEICRRPGIYGGRQQAILDTMLCAGRLQGGVDACGGDSGGPLGCETDGRFVLAGIVSWGDGCAKQNRPGVYTRVSSYVDWIYESASKLGLSIS